MAAVLVGCRGGQAEPTLDPMLRWAVTPTPGSADSNRVPPAYMAGALPVELEPGVATPVYPGVYETPQVQGPVVSAQPVVRPTSSGDSVSTSSLPSVSPRLEQPTPPPTTIDSLSAHESELRAAEARYGLPTGILTAIAWEESGYGQYACGFNFSGINSCRGYNYTSWAESIDATASLLAHWLGIEGNLDDALCIWESGQPCALSESGSHYRDVVLSLVP